LCSESFQRRFLYFLSTSLFKTQWRERICINTCIPNPKYPTHFPTTRVYVDAPSARDKENLCKRNDRREFHTTPYLLYVSFPLLFLSTSLFKNQWRYRIFLNTSVVNPFKGGFVRNIFLSTSLFKNQWREPIVFLRSRWSAEGATLIQLFPSIMEEKHFPKLHNNFTTDFHRNSSVVNPFKGGFVRNTFLSTSLFETQWRDSIFINTSVVNTEYPTHFPTTRVYVDAPSARDKEILCKRNDRREFHTTPYLLYASYTLFFNV